MRGGLTGPAAAAPKPRAADARAPSTGPLAPASVARGPRPDALVYVVLGVILTDVWRLHDLVPATRVVRPSLTLTALGFVLLAIGGGFSRAADRLRSPIALWFGVFVGLMLVGLPFSLDPAQSTDYFKSVVLPRVIAGFLVAASVRSVRDAEFLALGTLAGAFVYMVVHVTGPVDAEGRWTALRYYDVNDLALMLVVMIPLTLYFLRRANPTGRRVLAATCLALFAYAVVRTGSRGGFVGLAIVVAYLLFRYNVVPARVRLMGAAAVALALGVGGPAYLSRLETIVRPEQDYNWSAETGRMAIWQRGLGYVASRPLLGLGLNQFRTAESRRQAVRQERMAGRQPPPARGAHNMLLQVGAELGVLALLAFVLMLGIAWRTLTRLRDTPSVDGSPGPALSGALAASLLGFLVCGMFLHAAFFPVLPLLLGFAIALRSIGEARAPAVRARRGGLFAFNNGPPRVPA
jgi:O-antigen ligase